MNHFTQPPILPFIWDPIDELQVRVHVDWADLNLAQTNQKPIATGPNFSRLLLGTQ